MSKLITSILLGLLFFMPAASAAGQVQGQSWNKDQFPEFAAALAEMPPGDQKKFINESLIEYYDQDCHEKSRQVKRDSAVHGWKYVLPNADARAKEGLSIRISTDKKIHQWRVSLDKNETWLYGLIYFDWNESARSWLVSGFKFEMDEPGDCV